MQNQPLVTIGIPVYNEEKYLAETIESAINQSYKNIRIIISDNCSTDSSFEIASKYVNADNRIELIQHEKNIGAIENFTYTLSKCSTKYFMWLGAHDIILPAFIENAVNNMIADPSIVLYFPKAVFFEPGSEPLGCADSDIDTRNLSTVDAMLKVTNNLMACTALHGVFLTDKLRKLPLAKNSTDLILLFLSAAYGKLVSSEIVLFHRRIVRKETFTEQKERFKKIGMIDNSNKDIHFLRSMIYYKYLFEIPTLSFKEKIKLSIKIKEIFGERFSYFSWNSLLKYYFFSDFHLKAFLYVLYIKLYSFLGKTRLWTINKIEV